MYPKDQVNFMRFTDEKVITVAAPKNPQNGHLYVPINDYLYVHIKLECGPMPNVMAGLPNIGGALCSTPQTLADAHCRSTVQ